MTKTTTTDEIPRAIEALRDRPQGTTYFASGSNRAGEIRGLGRVGLPVGVCATEVLADCERRLPFRPGVLPAHARSGLDGTSLRASGFVPVARSKGGSWSREGRERTDQAPTGRKVRWERGLSKRARREVARRAEDFAALEAAPKTVLEAA